MARLTDHERRRIRDSGPRYEVGGSTPFADAPQAEVPKAVPYWQPGTLYQPGDLVQANDLGKVQRVRLANPDFEAGDTGWNKEANVVIEKAPAFQGEWRARFEGGTEKWLVWIKDATMYRTSDYTTVSSAKIHPDIPAGVQASCVSTGSRIVVVVPGRVFGGQTWPGLYWTDDGETFTKCEGLGSVRQFYNGKRLAAQPYTLEGAQTFFLYTDASNGYYGSDDGKTFTLVRPAHSREYIFGIERIWVQPASPNNYRLLTTGTRKLFKIDGSAASTQPLSQRWAFEQYVTGLWNGLSDWYISWDHDDSGDQPLPAAAVRSGSRTYVFTLQVPASRIGMSVVRYTVPSSSVFFQSVIGTNLWSDFAMSGGTMVWTKGGTDGVSAAQHGAHVSTFSVFFSSDAERGTSFAAFAAPQNSGLRYITELDLFVGFTNVNALVVSTDGIAWTKYQSATSWDWTRTANTVAGLVIAGKSSRLVNTAKAAVQPGQRIAASARIKPGLQTTARLGLRYYDAAGAILHDALGLEVAGSATATDWRELPVISQAPSGADTVTVLLRGSGSADSLLDQVEWDHYDQSLPPCRLYEATQTSAGKTGATEPVWPGAVGGTVTDGGVTWTAKAGNCITWEAVPILQSGATEPVWPAEEGASVADGSILWTADSGRIRDVNNPNGRSVVIAAGKVFTIDDDLVPYSATTNPMDWSRRDDAGYVPFGLNPHGDSPATVLALYRGNLVAWSQQGFQLWQVDEDPSRFALLDTVPVGNRYPRAVAAVSNDLVWLSDEGVRNLGTAGPNASLQAGYFGKAIDSLVLKDLATLADNSDALAFAYPGAGQYWLCLGRTVYVLTTAGGPQSQSWSRYTFPWPIEEATLADGELYLRSGDRVLQVDDALHQDDVGGVPADIEGQVWWHYLEAGPLGASQTLAGFDVTATGTYDVSVGYDQSDPTLATPPYRLTGDTVPGQIIPLPVTAPSFQFRLTWASGPWQWNATALYFVR